MQKEKKIAAERAKKEQAKRAEIRKREKEIAAAKAQKVRDAENAVKKLEQKKTKAEITEKSSLSEEKKLAAEIAAANKKLAELKK